MLSNHHRHKLIDGLVIAMGKPTSKMPPTDSAEPDEGSPDEESQDESEGIKCAKDAARALGMDNLDDDKAAAFAEAIRTIVDGYGKQ